MEKSAKVAAKINRRRPPANPRRTRIAANENPATAMARLLTPIRGTGRPAACAGANAFTVSVAVIAPLAVTDVGFMLQPSAADDGVQLRPTVPADSLTAARFKPALAEPPEATVTWASWGANVKSPCACITWMLVAALDDA